MARAHVPVGLATGTTKSNRFYIFLKGVRRLYAAALLAFYPSMRNDSLNSLP